MYVVDQSEKLPKINAGDVLCGFGRGKFDRNDNKKVNAEKHHKFHCNTCDGLISHEKLQALSEVVAEHIQNDPLAKMAYHSMRDIACTNPNAFSVARRHESYFAPHIDSPVARQTINQPSMGAFVLAHSYDGSHCLVNNWSVKWLAQGLGPMGPRAHFTLSAKIPPGQAMSLF